MKLVVVSYKNCWRNPGSPSGFSAAGGFPFQMEALSTLFEATTLVVPVGKESTSASGLHPLVGKNLSVRPLPRPFGSGLQRKIALFVWLPRHLPTIWSEIKHADALHAIVPGDIGVIGLLVGLIQRKRIFVRHCGTWGYKGTVANRFLMTLLQRSAKRQNVVVMATGGGRDLPSASNPSISWIFSSSLHEGEMGRSSPSSWQPETTLRLVTVARLTEDKNVQSCIEAVDSLRDKMSIHLSIVGDGVYRPKLQEMSKARGLDGCVTFHGLVSHGEVMKILSESHLFVFPTRVAEGFPKAVLEALACGVPVIATSVSVLPDLLGNGSGVCLTDPSSPLLTEAIERMVEDPSALARMSALAREASSEYTLERWAEVIGERLESAWGGLREEPSRSGRGTDH